MSLSINVGLSRRANPDDRSTGCSINITAELDSSLLRRPQELHDQIDNLYRQAQSGIDRQDCRSPRPVSDRPRHPSDANVYAGHANGNGRLGRSGYANDHGQTFARRSGGNGALMTDSQRRAIYAIAERANLDADAECRDLHGVAVNDLSLRQASDLIDHLKGLQPADGNGHGGR